MPAKDAPRFFRYYASSFFVGKPRSYRFCIKSLLLGITRAFHLAFGGLLGRGQGLLDRHLPGERRRQQLANRRADGLELRNGHVLDTDVGHGLG